jgi:hypothetical protein
LAFGHHGPIKGTDREQRQVVRHPRNSLYGYARLHRYPSVLVSIECSFCPHRKGRYRLVRLAAVHGPDILLDDLLDALVRCKWRRPATARPAGKYEMRCRAMFVEFLE